MKLELGQKVYHTDLYQGREMMKVVGIRKNQVELEGDYSGGIHNVCQKDWLSIDGILLEKNTKPNITAETCPKCNNFDKSHDPVDVEWICRDTDCRFSWKDSFNKNHKRISKEDLEKEFTPDFIKEFMFDAEFRTIFESISRGGSPYEMIEHLCKSKKEISKSLEKMIVNFGSFKK